MRFNIFYYPKGKFNIWAFSLSFIGNVFFTYCVIISLALILFSSVTIECVVSGSSMQPTLNADLKAGNDIVYVNKYDRDFAFGDIIVINEETSTDPLIKRVIGVGGDLIDIVYTNSGYKLEINGKLIEEDYLKINYEIEDVTLQNGNDVTYESIKNSLYDRHPEIFVDVNVGQETVKKILVPEGEIFALGDNRHVSKDSSYYGTFKLEQIEGTVERTKYTSVSSFSFYWDYIMNGEFFTTMSNCI